jgi:hypothetical protein
VGSRHRSPAVSIRAMHPSRLPYHSDKERDARRAAFGTASVGGGQRIVEQGTPRRCGIRQWSMNLASPGA